jgi:hypothetical protein
MLFIERACAYQFLVGYRIPEGFLSQSEIIGMFGMFLSRFGTLDRNGHLASYWTVWHMLTGWHLRI